MLPSLAAQRNDWEFVLGVRVGPITRESTLESLKRQFGAANVRQEMLSDEVQEYEGTVIYPDTPARRLAITWGDSGHPSEIDVGSLQQIGTGAWRGPKGITIGTGLLQLERLNGRAFHLAGFAWDYSGTVTSWDGGRLAPLKAGGLERGLDPGLREPTSAQSKFYEQVTGDGFFPSSHPAMQALNPRVSYFRVFFPK
jgi:hypothetical protein